jgi:proline iminopeptidase
MGAFGQPAHDILRTDNGHDIALGVPIDCRTDHQTTRLQKLLTRGEIALGVGDMFNNLHVQHDIELLSRFGHRLRGGVAVVDRQSGLFSMDARHGDVALRRIGANDLGTQSGHGFGEKTPATTDVEKTQTLEGTLGLQVTSELRRDLRGNVVQTAGVEHVQRLELAIHVPPFGRHRLELGDLGGIYGLRGLLWRGVHGHLPGFLRVLGGQTGPWGLYRMAMDKFSGQKRAAAHLFPPIDPFDQRMLDVGDGHQLYVEQCGNPEGAPVIVLHGGPGGGCSPAMRRYFSPEDWRIILFDQRGCGRSRPHASVRGNTTWHLVADIERIRHTLGIERWAVFGGSWGATLGLVYAQTHSEHVAYLALRGVFLAMQRELDWFYGGGAGQFWPDQWARFVAMIPEEERGDLIKAYNKRLFSGDLMVETRYARAWASWENALASMESDGGGGDSPADYARAFARLENHYFLNRGFLEEDGQILRDVHRIAHIPGTIVQGRYDMICPPKSAHSLASGWSSGRLHMIRQAGHALSEAGISEELVRVMKIVGQRREKFGL